jgi:hypothetical protein
MLWTVWAVPWLTFVPIRSNSSTSAATERFLERQVFYINPDMDIILGLWSAPRSFLYCPAV